ncbi:MAG: ArsR/SmtB family transcription factor [Candidatus Hodarchaeales archaeon]|jgi:DNA-binding transcriptional ArsR family regulator
MNDKNPSISKVLKAINSTQRRDILRTLNFFRRPLSFTELMKELEASSTSSRFSYHLNVLVDAGLASKDGEGKYGLTQLGSRTGLLLELSQEDEKSVVFSSLYLAYSNLTPGDCLIATLVIPSLVVFISGVFIYFNLLLIIAGGVTIVSIFTYLYSKMNSIVAMIFFSSFLWVVFVPGKVYLAAMYLLLLVTCVPLMYPADQLLPFPFNLMLSVFTGFATLIVAAIYYQKYS